MSVESPPTPVTATVETPRAYSRRETAGWMLLTGGSQGIKLVVTLLSAAILARLLRPEDFGLIATATPVFAFATMLQNLGLAEALYQRPNLERGHVNALFVITVGISLAFSVVLFLLAPLIASLFKEPRLVQIIWAMAGVALLIAIATIPFGMLSRKLRFKQFAAVDVASSVGGIVAGVVFAMLTHNYWALVVMQAATALIMVIGAFAFAGWAPGKPTFDGELRKMVGLGAGFSAFNLLNFLSRNADLLLISFVHGPGPLGLYERAYKLTMFPLWQAIAPINRVLSPVLSRLQHDPVTYRERYFETTSIMMAAVQPGLIAAIVFSSAAVGIILGPGWGGSAPIFFWLGLTGLVQIYAYPVAWLLISQGRAKECAAAGAVTAAIAIASFLIGLPFGPLGVAMAYAIGDITLRTPIAWWFAGRRGPVTFASLVSNFIPHATAMAAAAAVLAALSRVWAFESFPELCLAALISYAVYAPVLFIFPDKRRLARLVLTAVQRRLRARAPKPAVTGGST
ncbi:MAG TPA: lipopolysaccharide biosynthesis protein [Hyphomonadaceae bacterium]|jgi:PST family polysaccharide transporter|nr:lipopolysaccharide biosynthesis protein [Hyphomonadaceae bacterium]